MTYSGLLLKFKNNGQESFITLPPGANVIKLFLFVIYEFLDQARVFVKIDYKSFPVTNILAYYESSYLTAVKSFITLAPGVNIMKIFPSK